MQIPGQMCILNALNKDGYFTGETLRSAMIMMISCFVK